MEAMNAPTEPLDGLVIDGGLVTVGGATDAGAGVGGAPANPIVGSSAVNASSKPAHPGWPSMASES